MRAIAAVGQEYLEYLWHLMHHYESEDGKVMALTSYLDDSGSDDRSPVTVIGGPVMAKDAFRTFNDKWSILLDRYRIPPPFHMNDFVRPKGKHVSMYRELKLALFSDVTNLINEHKLYSISVEIPQPEFKTTLPENVRKQLIGPYAFAFFCAVLANQIIGQKSRLLQETVAYLVDSGFSYGHQLLEAHAAIMAVEKSAGGFHYTGAMAFDTDDRVSALQAADVIAWSARRRSVTGLAEEFEPLEQLLDEDPPMEYGKWRGPHGHVSMPIEGIEMLAKPIINWLSMRGTVPSLTDFLR